MSKVSLKKRQETLKVSLKKKKSTRLICILEKVDQKAWL